MNQESKIKRIRRARRHQRVRARIIGTAERPRLAVYRSLTQLNAQLIDDAARQTLLAINTAGLKGDAGELKGKMAESFLGGKQLAAAACAKKIKNVVFDRGGFRYHGRIKAFAEGARAGGLEF